MERQTALPHDKAPEDARTVCGSLECRLGKVSRLSHLGSKACGLGCKCLSFTVAPTRPETLDLGGSVGAGLGSRRSSGPGAPGRKRYRPSWRAGAPGHRRGRESGVRPGRDRRGVQAGGCLRPAPSLLLSRGPDHTAPSPPAGPSTPTRELPSPRGGSCPRLPPLGPPGRSRAG